MEFFFLASYQEKSTERNTLVNLGREEPKLIWMSDQKLQKSKSVYAWIK